MIKVDILADSVNPKGIRLTTLQLYYPRFILPQLNTYRAFSRCTQSSRAVPIQKVIQSIKDNPVRPKFGGAQKGMVSGPIDEDSVEALNDLWDNAARSALQTARQMEIHGAHKEAINRILEPYMHVRTVVSATDWSNFFRQRISPNAQHEIHELAAAIQDALAKSLPTNLKAGQWHIPYFNGQDSHGTETDLKVAVARCARVSYTNHDGNVSLESDLRLFEQLKRDMHLSPFEHVAQALNSKSRYANFKGFRQYRALLENDADYDREDSTTGHDKAPLRYMSNGREAIDDMRDNSGKWFAEAKELGANDRDAAFYTHCLATAFKYRARLGKKDDIEQDNGKAEWYEQMARYVVGTDKDPRAYRK